MDWCSELISFVATGLATFGGVGLAYHLENKRIEKEKKEKEEMERKEFIKLLLILQKSLVENKNAVDDLYEVVNQEKDNIKAIFPIDLATWEEIGPELNKNLKNRDLRNDLAQYFQKLKEIVKLEDRYFYFATKTVPSFSSELVFPDKTTQAINTIFVSYQKRWEDLSLVEKDNINIFYKEFTARVDKLLCDIQIEQTRLSLNSN